MAAATDAIGTAGRRAHRGSCHCGAVVFECEADLSAGTQRCNCSICSKQRFWKAMVPASDFRLLSGKALLSEYQFGSNRIRHSFCSICGIKPFGTVEVPDLGALVAVNVACLEGLTEDQLAAVPVRLEDGRDDAWSKAPREGSYL